MSEARKSGQKEVINVVAEINKLEKKLINPKADFLWGGKWTMVFLTEKEKTQIH